RALFDEFTITKFPGDPEIVLTFACTKAALYVAPLAVVDSVLPTLSGIAPIATSCFTGRRKSPSVIVRVAGVAPLLEAATMKLNVPAISVDDREVMVIEPSAPVIGVAQPAVDTASTTDPPGTCGSTPSGYVPGARIFASDIVMIVAAVVLD